MLVFLWSIWGLLAIVNGQGSAPSEQEVVLLLTSPIFVCDDDNSKAFMDTTEVETVRFNESLTFVRGKLKMLKSFESDSMLEIRLDKIANGKKEMVFSIEVKLCDEIGREDSDFYSLLKYLVFPAACPIEEGEYVIDDLVAELDDLPINSSNMGEYEAGLYFFKCLNDNCKEKEQLACAKLDCVIEPV
ncbi:hypothetical protein O0L34_g6518 [Tuta absoluta]|nr:hypothetical protein O0L34_g6518 [Tuta absoluta]